MFEGWPVESDVAVVGHLMNVPAGVDDCTVVQIVMHEVLRWVCK